MARFKKKKVFLSKICLSDFFRKGEAGGGSENARVMKGV
jgi:hypothetical protein